LRRFLALDASIRIFVKYKNSDHHYLNKRKFFMSKKSDTSSIIVLVAGFVLLIIAALIFSALVFFVAPGAAIAAAISYLSSKEIDVGQAWTFAILINSGILCAYYAFFRNRAGTQNAYLLTCVLVAGIYTVAIFGFHAQWAADQVSYFLPRDIKESTLAMQEKSETASLVESVEKRPQSDTTLIKSPISLKQIDEVKSITSSVLSTETLASKNSLNLGTAAIQPDIQPQPGNQVPTSPSFSCNAATGKVEVMICNNNNLAELDVELKKLYDQAKVSASLEQLKAEQLNWLKNERNICISAECIFLAYQGRISQLRQ
jgi:uncharacterized protein YecT (DUF1311 family)